jgi:hypothetical protein
LCGEAENILMEREGKGIGEEEEVYSSWVLRIHKFSEFRSSILLTYAY